MIKTIPKVKFQGRLQYIYTGKLKKLLKKNEKLLLDGCHSHQSAKNLLSYLKTIQGPIYGIWGMQKNKLPEKFIKTFRGIFKKIITVKIPNERNALSANKLKKIVRKFKFVCETAPNINEAIKKCSDLKKKTIVIFGSLYLVGSALRKN